MYFLFHHGNYITSLTMMMLIIDFFIPIIILLPIVIIVAQKEEKKGSRFHSALGVSPREVASYARNSALERKKGIISHERQ
jgi:hypothetical protein